MQNVPDLFMDAPCSHEAPPKGASAPLMHKHVHTNCSAGHLRSFPSEWRVLESEHLPYHVAFLQGGAYHELEGGRGSGFRTFVCSLISQNQTRFLSQIPRVHRADPEHRARGRALTSPSSHFLCWSLTSHPLRPHPTPLHNTDFFPDTKQDILQQAVISEEPQILLW